MFERNWFIAFKFGIVFLYQIYIKTIDSYWKFSHTQKKQHQNQLWYFSSQSHDVKNIIFKMNNIPCNNNPCTWLWLRSGNKLPIKNTSFVYFICVFIIHFPSITFFTGWVPAKSSRRQWRAHIQSDPGRWVHWFLRPNVCIN